MLKTCVLVVEDDFIIRIDLVDCNRPTLTAL